MRRNFNAGQRGGQNWGSSSRVSGGRTPMVADLGLQDIDKELELLQRKREIIEQQQQMLSNEFRGKNEYEESYNQSSRFYDFSQSYNDRRDNNPPSRKRPIPVWEDDIPNKRMSGGPDRSRSRPVGRAAPPPLMRSGPLYNPQLRPVRPLSGPFRPKPPRRSPPKSIRGPGTPTTKPRPVDRKKSSEPNNAPDVKFPEELNRLCGDREPTKQMIGRLELALGCILKEMRAELGEDTLKAPAVCRDVKAVIRDRIREIMMGQVVGTAESIIAQYREVYDKRSDADLVANAVQAQTGDVTPLKIVDPEKYFKVNMYRIMQMKLKRLLDQVEEANRADANVIKTESVTETGESNTDETKEKIADPVEEDIKPLDETIINTEKFKALEKLMTGRLLNLMKKCMPSIMRVFDIDAKYTRLRNMITTETVKMLVGKNDQEINKIVEEANKSIDETNKTPYKPLPYYAKLMGRPGLPKRNQMEEFFEQYKPKSIKKHRSVHNLLFVGFTDKEGIDNFIKADGTVIGKHTLSIRYSDKARTESNGKHPGKFNSSITSQNDSIMTVNSSTSDDKLIGSELDDQITNLLTSIRNEEENDESVTEGDEVKTDENDVKTEETDVQTDENVDKTDENVDKTDENDDKTDENDDKTDENDANTEENDANTEKNDAKTEGNDESEVNVDENEENADADANMEENAKTEITEEKTSIDTDMTNVTESNEATENGSEKQDNGTEEMEKADEIKPLDDKPLGRSTPARACASTRAAATPSRIQTRRASRLAQQDA